MSDNEELVQKGKLLADFQKAKETLKERRSQASRLSECFFNMAKLLQDETLSDATLDGLISDLPTQQAMTELVAAVRESQKTIRRIQKEFQQSGVEIK